MATYKDIVTTYLTCRDNKRKSAAQAEFELRWQARCLALTEAINNREADSSVSCFIVTVPKPREVFASDMEGRIIDHYIDDRMRPLLEERLSPHTYNNRKGMGAQACVNAVIEAVYEASRGYTIPAWLIKLDLKGCFPNIVQEIAYEQQRAAAEAAYHGADKDDLLYLIRRASCCYPAEHCTMLSPPELRALIPAEKSVLTKPDGIGAIIGRLYWQNSVNWYFHEVDEYLEAMGVRFVRYVDDIYIVTNTKDTLLLIPHIREILAGLGATLHPRKFYCQEVRKGFECLGYHIKPGRIHLNSRTLARAISKARRYSHHACADKAGEVLSSLNSYFGLLKAVTGYKAAMRIVDALGPKWQKYVKYDERRKCLVALPEYSYRNRIINKYHLK